MIEIHNIVIDGSRVPLHAPSWNPATYEQVVVRNLRRILRSPVGQAIAPQITRRLRIIPTLKIKTHNASAGADDPVGASRRGLPIRACNGVTVTDPLPGYPPGTGVGSDATIQFVPADFYDPTRGVRFGWIRFPPPGLQAEYQLRQHGAGAYSDEVLCHEMVHAIRVMRGVSDCRRVGYRYDTYEEFCAVLVTNMYSSQFRRPLRDGHGTAARFRTISPFDGPRMQEEARWIDEMRRDQPGFCHALRSKTRQEVPYNPFRDLRPGSVPTYGVR